MKRRLRQSITLAAMVGWGTAQAAEPVAFSAHYTADWKSINVGTSDLVLTPGAAPGSYLYIWTVTARGVFRIVYSSDVVQKSWLSVVQGHVCPERYRAQEGSANASIDFDWHNGRARGVSEEKPVDIALPPGTQDVMSIQVEVMLDLAAKSLPNTFRILDKNEIKAFDYLSEGSQRIHTALGELDTDVVSSRRPGGNRVLRMYFAPSLHYVPVLAERMRDGNLEFAMRIKTLAIR